MSESVTVQVPDQIEGEFITSDKLPFDIHVDNGEDTRIFEINETDLGRDHPAYRNFSIDGGIPASMLEDELVVAIEQKLGLHMQSIAHII